MGNSGVSFGRPLFFFLKDNCMDLIPTTELEAVNLMLQTIGESPVNTLEDVGVVDAVVALSILQMASRQVQLIGWHWNTEDDFPLAPSFPEGEIRLPSNTLKVDTSQADASFDLVQRGTRLYDRVNHTYTIGRTIRVEIVVFLPFDELPEAARAYIAIRAARQFQEKVVGSDVLRGFTKLDEMQAMAALLDAEAETQDFNILTGNESVARILRR